MRDFMPCNGCDEPEACEIQGRCLEPAPQPGEWRAMVYAPRDGTEVELLLYHPNRQYANGIGATELWEQVVRAKWIDFNHGGWTWEGMYGSPQGWRPCGVTEVDRG